MKRIFHTVVVLSAFLCGSCSHSERQVQEVPVVQQDSALVVVEPGELPFQEKPLSESDIVLLRELLYDKYTLDDVYPYRDTVRVVKWDIVRKSLAFIENMQEQPAAWGVFQNYKNRNGEAPLVATYRRNVYRRVSDTLGVERYQSVPLFPSDTSSLYRTASLSVTWCLWTGKTRTLLPWNGRSGVPGSSVV